ncbi:hypothetical protein FOZ63_018554 [Perkinsus olseni]|uniref:Uncharacterized protein n=1 Tax=Perkinsus olseni TaxID=32597 RepID=A0A7J6RMG0_PEROL|nr:hypothetical protein FOZ62_023742 [Perkinsus olseni]KAF4725457.1 hypothetical protein FOZ63_018554 [Perkinsus olseni]
MRLVLLQAFHTSGTIPRPKPGLVEVYRSIGPIGNFSTIFLSLDDNMLSSITFYLPGMSDPLFVRRHQLQSDGAGCLRYSAGAPRDMALADSSMEDVKKRLGDGFSQELDWSDMKVCPDTVSTVRLILNHRSHVLRRVDKFILAVARTGPRESNRQKSHHEDTRVVASSATVARRPEGNSVRGVLEQVSARKSPSVSLTGKQQQVASVNLGDVHRASPPTIVIYENTEPVPGLRKMRLALRNQVLCSLEFYRQGASIPLIIGPYKMIPSLVTGFLKYDLSHPSLYQKVAADLNRLTELWAGDRAEDILPTAIAICPLDDAHVELIIGTEGYKMTSTSIPVFNENPGRSSYLATTLAADPENRGLASLSRERKRPKTEEVRGAASPLSSAPIRNVVAVQRFDEETKQEAVDAAASEPPKRQRLDSPVETQTKLNATGLPSIGVYENESPILNFTKVHMRIEADASCSFVFWLPGSTLPASFGPFRMITCPLTGCLGFDLRDISVRSRVVASFKGLSKRLSLKGFGKIYATEVKVCGSPSGQVELSIANIRYPMQPTKAPIRTSRSLETKDPQGAADSSGRAALQRFLRAKRHQPPRGVAPVDSPESHSDGKDARKHFPRAKGYQPSPKVTPARSSKGRATGVSGNIQGVEISREGSVDVDLFEDLWAQLTRSPTEPSPGSLRLDALLDYLDPMHDGPI